MDIQALPIGTVVQIKGGETPLMIVTQFPVTEKEGKQGYFDFGGVSLPIGLMGQELAFFNKEDIAEVIFMGYINLSFQDFASKYEAMVKEIPYERFTVEGFNR